MTVLPPFRPHPLLRGGHAQTFATLWRFGPEPPGPPELEYLRLADDDEVALLHTAPAQWSAGDPVALLIHGLTGDHTSRYMRRITARLVERGSRVVTMDARGHGLSLGRGRYMTHAGRSSDVVAALEHVTTRFAHSSLGIAGFSLGGNQVAKALGEDPDALPETLERAILVNAPLDLGLSIAAVERPRNRFYDRRFTGKLNRLAGEMRQRVSDLPWPELPHPARSVREFDELLTAPVAGFDSADDYYTRCSAAPLMTRVQVPTLALSAADDPLVPAAIYDGLAVSENVRIHIAPSGGHLGYIARDRGPDPDRRWMDARVVDWLTGRSPEQGG